MEDPSNNGFDQDDRKKTKKGALLSVVGGVVLAGVRAMGFVLRAIFGGEMWGLYAIAWALIELCAFFLVGGSSDAIVIFSSRQRHADARSQDNYRAIATIISIPLLMAFAVALGIHLFSESIYLALWSEHDPLLIELTKTLAWSLPLLVLVQIPAEATRSTLHFGFAIGVVQIAFPILSLLAALLLYATTTPSILAVAQGTLLALVLCVPFSLYGYARHFDLMATFRELFSVKWDREALSFALPQSLNMMLNQGLVRLDSLMLSFFGVSANAIGIYSLVSDLTQLIRLAKMAFSGVFSPLVAKYRAQNNPRGTEEALEYFMRKTSALGMLLLLAVMSLWPLFIFKPGETWDESVAFAWLLCAGPMMSCFFGLCGNTLLMYGYSRTLLYNALGSGLINLVLNALFIPAWGIFGAALATAIANVTISVLQITELSRFEGLRPRVTYYARTLAAALFPVGFVLLGSTMLESPTEGAWGLSNTAFRVLLASAAVALYAASQLLFPGQKPWGAPVPRAS